MTDRQKTILELALEYHRRGWCIIPIRAGTKLPAIRSWKQYQTKRPDEEQLRKWFANGKYTSFAVVCGAVSGGVTVLDLDSERRCQWWNDTHPALAQALFTAKTKKGLHIYFRSEPFRKQKGDEMDLLCEGAYAVLPPSPEKEWLTPLNGELPLLDPFDWGLEQFGINRPYLLPESNAGVTEEREDIEEIEEKEAISVSVSYSELDRELKKKVDFAITRTLPDKRGYRNFLTFQFCRWLKSISEFEKLRAKAVKSLCREWHRRALPKIDTKPFDETWADFVYGWNRVKYPKGEGMLKIAVDKALEAINHLSAEQEYESEEAQLLVRICYELQRLQGENPFFLSCYSAGYVLGVSHKKANKMLQMLVADEIIVLVEKNTTTRATRYRYVAA